MKIKRLYLSVIPLCLGVPNQSQPYPWPNTSPTRRIVPINAREKTNTSSSSYTKKTSEPVVGRSGRRKRRLDRFISAGEASSGCRAEAWLCMAEAEKNIGRRFLQRNQMQPPMRRVGMTSGGEMSMPGELLRCIAYCNEVIVISEGFKGP